MNIGTVVRNANAFGAASVQIVGRRRWNRRGAMVTDRYQHIGYHVDAASLATWAADQDLDLIGIDNTEGSVPIETHRAAEAVCPRVRPGRAGPVRGGS